MSDLDAYERRLLEGWEEVFKRGQLTLWVLLALLDGDKHMAEIRTWVADVTCGGVTVEERSLYRALQRFRDSEMIDHVSAAGARGPDRKVYRLGPVGRRVLGAFVDRDVRAFTRPEVVRLLDAATRD